MHPLLDRLTRDAELPSNGSRATRLRNRHLRLGRHGADDKTNTREKASFSFHSRKNNLRRKRLKIALLQDD